MFIQNISNTFCLYLYDPTCLSHFCFSVIRNKMVDFFLLFLEYMPQSKVQNMRHRMGIIVVFKFLKLSVMDAFDGANMSHKLFLNQDCMYFCQKAMFKQSTKFSFVCCSHKFKSSVPYLTTLRKVTAKNPYKLDSNLLKDGTIQKSLRSLEIFRARSS